MKALINTIVLAAILVVAVLYLQRMPRGEKQRVEETLEVAEPLESAPTTVKSNAPERSRVDASDFETTNTEALFQTGCELFDLWHVPDAVDVFEAVVAKDPKHFAAHARLVEGYAHPTMSNEAKSRDHLQACRSIAAETGADTLRINALRRLFVHPVPSLAAAQLADLVAANPQDVDVRLQLAQALLMDHRADEARNQLVELLEGDPTIGRARELLVRACITSGDLEGAERHARDLAALYSEEPYPYVLLATVLLIEGQLKDATEFCDNALLIDSRYIPAIALRGRLYAAQGRIEASRVSFEKLLLFDDPMVRAVGMEGVACADFLSGRFEDATENMDQAVRLAMSAGSARRGLIYAFRLVDYLCELGRVDAADAVLNRWVNSRGEIPAHLGRLRVSISGGNLGHARAMLQQIEDDERWHEWMRILDLDFVQYQALAFISEKRYGRALSVLASPNGEGIVGTRRYYLRGFALFQSGEAERAAPFLKQTRFRQHSDVFPYDSDPVLRVQSIFFLGEASLARGEGTSARRYYKQFLRYWGGADWNLQAVSRAREKVSTLAPPAKG